LSSSFKMMTYPHTFTLADFDYKLRTTKKKLRDGMPFYEFYHLIYPEYTKENYRYLITAIQYDEWNDSCGELFHVLADHGWCAVEDDNGKVFLHEMGLEYYKESELSEEVNSIVSKELERIGTGSIAAGNLMAKAGYRYHNKQYRELVAMLENKTSSLHTLMESMGWYAKRRYDKRGNSVYWITKFGCAAGMKPGKPNWKDAYTW